MPDQPARILHLLDDHDDAVREALITLVTRLDRRRFEVTVAGSLSEELRMRLSRAGIRWANTGLPEGAAPSQARARRLALQRLVRSQAPDLLQAHTLPVAQVAASALRAANSATALIVSVYELASNGGAGPQGWRARRRRAAVLGRAHTLVACSRALKASFAQLVPAEKLTVIPPGLDLLQYNALVDAAMKKQQLGVDPSAAVVACLARLLPGEGVDTFLQAAALVNQALPNVDFVVIGDGTLRQELEQMAHELLLAGNTVFAGRRHDLPGVLPIVDVVAVPLQRASFTLAPLQALAYGLPIVASATESLCEMLEGAPDTRLVPPGEPEAMAQALRRILARAPEDLSGEGSVLMARDGRRPVRMLVRHDAYELSEPDDWSEPRLTESLDEMHPARRFVAVRFSSEQMVAAHEALYGQVLASAGLRP